MSLGSRYLQFRQKFEHGLRVAYFRDVVRPRILQTRPIADTRDSTCEIHVLTHREDWLNLLWVLKSFYFYSMRKYSLCIHEDGTLTESEVRFLRIHFPNARIIRRVEADDLCQKWLKDKPRSQAFRNTNPLALKVFDFPAFLRSDRMFLLDSDVLFFSNPQSLLARLEDPHYTKNTLNRDWRYGYSIRMDPVHKNYSFPFPARINSGLGLIHQSSLEPHWMEEFLHLPDVLSHHHRIEQTLIALSSCRYGFEFLPPEYDVHTGPLIPGHPCRHFTGPIRHRMYSEGFRQLYHARFLKIS